MERRYVSVWFRHLSTDWVSLRKPELKSVPFVLRTPVHGRMVITQVNACAEEKGIFRGMVLADARAMVPDLKVEDDQPELVAKVLWKLAEWCIRFSPVVATDSPDGLMIDASGCTHLWGGDLGYINAIERRLTERGYDVQLAIAESPGVAWGMARFSVSRISDPGELMKALLPLPPEALRLAPETVERLHKLGLKKVSQLIAIPRSSLRRRFGEPLLQQLDKAMLREEEHLEPVLPLEPYQERLPFLEPVVTREGIEMAIKQVLQIVCTRLQREQKGLRKALLKGFRVDGKVVSIDVATNRASNHEAHLFKLFELKISCIEPGLGIELFVLEAPIVEDYFSFQGKMWEDQGGLDDIRLAELMDRLAGTIGADSIHRFLPDEHYWPERSFKSATSLQEKPSTVWREDRLRPLRILKKPHRIEVTAPVPDYPPMLFRYKGKIHLIAKADGPERIEQEWWISHGQHRDYYRVEDDEGHRYWIFRLGHYDDKVFEWFLHGFFP